MPNQPPTRHGLSLPLLVLACLVLLIALLLDILSLNQANAASPLTDTQLLTYSDMEMLPLEQQKFEEDPEEKYP